MNGGEPHSAADDRPFVIRSNLILLIKGVIRPTSMDVQGQNHLWKSLLYAEAKG
jgi:hypothetical protein